MRDSSIVSFGSHTYDMHYLEDDKAEFLHENKYNAFFEDINKSRGVMKKELGVDVTSIAYPFGDTSDEVSK